MKAVVVLSGGQDSAICLALAVKKYGADEVAAMTFRYGQRHSIEVTYARRLARQFGVGQHKVVDFGFISKLTTSALIGDSLPIVRPKGAKCPTSVVEGRNAFFLMAAAVWAKSLGAHVVYTGVSEVDSSGYPDCRGQFIRAQEKSINLALDYKVKILTPFLSMTKAEEWALADKLGILEIVEKQTVSCYNGIPGSGCGKCPACRLRNSGLKTYLKSVNQKRSKRSVLK